jgi:PrcB C-terminal
VDDWRRSWREPAKDVYGLLDNIRTDPHYWRAVGSLDQLRLLLAGYREAVEISGSHEALDFPFGNPGPFSVWLRLQIPALKTTSPYDVDWPSALENQAATLGVPPLDLFFTMVDQFRAVRAAYRFGGQATEVPDAPSAVEVPFAPNDQAVMGWFEEAESRSRGVYPIVAALRAQPEWHRFWGLDPRAGMATPVPDVDFTASMVLVVEIGGRPSSGHSVEIERIAEVGGVLYVCAVETRPGPNCFKFGMVTYPDTWATTPHFDGPLRVVLSVRTKDCWRPALLSQDLEM